MTILGATIWLAIEGALSSEVANIFTAALISYHAANAAVRWKDSGN